VQISYGAFRRSVSRTAISDPFLVDLQVSSSQQYVSRSLESCDNFSATMAYKTATGGRFKTHLVKSSPFLTIVFDGATPVISSPVVKILAVDAKVVRDSVGSQYIITLGNFQKWLLYCSEPVAFIWKENTLTAPVPIKGVVRVAVLPVGTFEQAFYMLLGYAQRYPTGATMSFSYPTGTTTSLTIQYQTVGSGPLLMLALPHHFPLLTTPSVDADENKRVCV
jgi:endoglucanase Acf2